MYDIIIIGAGTAGISAYKEAIQHTQNILIINKGPWDTTCARVGCMPSKVLISVANRMHDIQNAQEVALTVQSDIDTSAVMQHVQTLRDRFTQATIRDVDSWKAEHKISGEAKFINSNTVEVNNQQYQAKNFIIAVGSTPNFDPNLKTELGNKLITSDEIFELNTLPKSLAVIGSGVIAIELAQAMHRLGVQTTVFTRSRKVGVLSSPNLQALALNELQKEINFKFEILPEHIKNLEHGVEISFTENDQIQKLEVDYILNATGRRSNLDTLQLENIDTKFTDLKTLPINLKTKQLSNLPIFIIGDAFTSKPVQHEASNEGKYAIQSCLNFPKFSILDNLTPLGIVFSSPEMAIIGRSFTNLKQENIEFITGFVNYEKQGRAIVLGKNKGAVEIYIDKASKKLLGAEFFIDSAEHLAHLLSWMISEDLTIDEILKKPFYHPTIEEGLRTALKHARRQLDAN